MELITSYCWEPSQNLNLTFLEQSTSHSQPYVLSKPFIPEEISEDSSQDEELTESGCRQIVVRISIGPDNLANVRTILFNRGTPQKCRSIHQKTLLIRHIMRGNQQPSRFNIKVNPENGIFGVDWTTYLPKHLSPKRELILNDILDVLFETDQELQREYRKILYLLNNEQQQQHSQKYPQAQNSLKSYVESSSHYAWRVLEDGKNLPEKSAHPDDAYLQKKKEFRKLRGPRTKCPLIRNLTEALGRDRHETLPFFVLKVDEDEELRMKYLQSAHAQRSIEKSVCYRRRPEKITTKIPKEENDCQSWDSDTMYSSHRYGGYEESILFGIVYESTDDNNPKCEEEKSSKKSPLTFKNYLKRNSSTISLQSKMDMLIDIIGVLRQLKNHSIVYNNLRPSTVLVKRGLSPVLSDFTNAYSATEGQQEYEFQDYFPYVSVSQEHLKPYQNEKSDSFSFGALMFYCIYGKDFKDVKASSIKTLTHAQRRHILHRQEPFSLEKVDYYGGLPMKLLTKLMMKCQHHKDGDGKDSSQNGLESRPYLDWLYIILRFATERTSLLGF